MNKAGKKPTHLLFAAACLLLVSACDFSGGGLVATPLPEPVAAPSPAVPAPGDDTTFDNVATFEPCTSATAASCTSDAEVSGGGISKAAAAVDARIGQLQTGITVTVTGNADRRCTPAKSTACAQGKYLKAGSGGASDKNNGWSDARSRTVTADLQKELKNNPGNYQNYAALRARGESVTWNRISAGETYARYDDTTCRKAGNKCADDRASDIVVTSLCGAAACTTTPTTDTTTPTTGTTTPTTEKTDTTTPTTGTTAPPPTTLPPRPNESVQYLPTRAFQNAQQNTDQRIVIKAPTIVCPDCQQPPASTPGVLYGWSATLKSGTVSFTLTPPAGYATPRDYKITSNPNGKSALSDQTAVMRFYTATRSGAPYRYSVTSTIDYTMRLWKLSGSTLTYVQEESIRQTNTRSCTPSSCSFGVLGSNLG